MQFKIKNSSAFAEATADGKCKIGFTLIELLVVLAVILILAALLLPVLVNARARSVRMQCLSNIKQVDLLLLMYGHENNDRLPSTISCANLPNSVVAMAGRGGLSHRVFYDPGLVEANRAVIGGNTSGDMTERWSSNVLYRPIGYCLAIPGAMPLLPEYMNSSILPQPIRKGMIVLPPPNASQRVLVAGFVYAENPGVRPKGFNAHMDSKGFPLGDNFAMLDGSAKWRKFKDTLPRSSSEELEGGALWW